MISFIVLFRDGFQIDLANTQQQDAIDKFNSLVYLTKNAKTIEDVDDVRSCPDTIAGFIRSKNN